MSFLRGRYKPEGTVIGDWDYLLFYFGHGGYPDEQQYRRNIKNPDVIQLRSESAVQTTAYRDERPWDRIDADQFSRLSSWLKEQVGQGREITTRADADWIRFSAWVPANLSRFQKDREDAMATPGSPRPYAYPGGLTP